MKQENSKLTLAKRICLTRDIDAAAAEFKDAHNFLVEATEQNVYGKRAYDLMAPVGKTATPENRRLSNKIIKTERALKKGDDNAEFVLRDLQAKGKYGKRCSDINLGTEMNNGK